MNQPPSQQSLAPSLHITDLPCALVGNILDFLTYEGFAWLFLYGTDDGKECQPQKELKRRVFFTFPNLYQLQQKAFEPQPLSQNNEAALSSTISSFARSPKPIIQNVAQLQHLLQQFRGSYSLCDSLKNNKDKQPRYRRHLLEARWCRSFLKQAGCTMFANSPAVSEKMKEYYHGCLSVAERILPPPPEEPSDGDTTTACASLKALAISL